MPDADAVTAAIARNLRALRAARGWTLDTLAARTGVSKGMLVQVEQARTNPSIGTLCRLSDGLGVPLVRLVEIAEQPAVRLVRAARAPELWRTPAGSRATLLVGSDPPNPLELWDWRVAPGEAHDSEGHQAGTRELLTVVDGVLTLTVGGERHRVEVGDGVLFDGGRPHRYANDGPAPLRFTLAVHAPVPSPGTP